LNAYHVSLSQNEKQTLEQMYNFATKRRLRQRAHMVLVSNEGYCQKQVAAIVRVSYETARRCIHGYSVYGIAALYDEEKSGRPSQLTDTQHKQMDIWLSQCPRELGYNQSNWTARLMQYHLLKVFSVQLSNERVRQLIHQLGYSLVRPRHTNDHLVDEEEKKRL